MGGGVGGRLPPSQQQQQQPPPSNGHRAIAFVIVGCSIGFVHLLLVLTLLVGHDDVATAAGLEMSTAEKRHLREEAREMFYHAYNAYMNHAYPADELMPLSCRGRYRESEPSRGDIDDALGNFSLTLVDAMDTLVVLGDLEGFESAVKLVLRDVTFDHDIVVSVFETNIRMLGGLLSGHILAGYLRDKLGQMSWYGGELLDMAKDLGYRLLPAFNTSTGVPHPRINLRYGLKSPKMANSRETCTACAGTMILEFAALSRLTGEPIFEEKTHRAMDYLWHLRHRASGLMGMVLNIHNGDWVRRDSGVGAGIDSYYEYLLKAYILLGDDTYLDRFNKHYSAIMKYVSQGPLLVDVHMHRPHTNTKNFMDALLAFWPGLQVLKGDIKPAIETHEMLYQVMQRHNFLPEAFTTDFKVHWGQHPLRPEFLESTYFLYKATDDPYYLEVGRSVLTSLKRYGRVPCGFAAVKDVRTGSHEDRMDSFVLAETFKYLFLLFADDDDLIIDINDFLFTTEAHLLPLTLAKLSNTSSIGATAGRSVGSRPILLKRVSTLDDAGSGSGDGNGDDGEDLEEAEEADYDHTCPNTEYLFPGKKDFAHSIRLPLKNLVDGVCPRQRSSSHRQLHATEFQAGNEEHLRLLRKMGISIAALSDGRVQLQHASAQAQSSEDAEEGLLFMQEMIELSRSQEHQLSQQPKAVHFVARFANATSRITVLAAGPAQFGPELVAPKQVVALAGLASPLRACTKLTNAESLYKRIGVVERGDCMFVDKARQLQRAGAVAGIVIDNTPGTSSSTSPLFAMSGDGSNDVHIPMVFLFSQDASALLDAIAVDRDLVVFLTESKDGDQNGASETKTSAATGTNAAEGSLEVTSYVRVVDDDEDDDEALQSAASLMQFAAEDGSKSASVAKRVISLNGGPIPPESADVDKTRITPIQQGLSAHAAASATDDHQPLHSKPSVLSGGGGADDSKIVDTDDDTLKDVTRLDVDSIITLWQREKEYVLSLQRLIQTAFGDKKELDADTKLLLGQLGELMKPKEQAEVIDSIDQTLIGGDESTENENRSTSAGDLNGTRETDDQSERVRRPENDEL